MDRILPTGTGRGFGTMDGRLIRAVQRTTGKNQTVSREISPGSGLTSSSRVRYRTSISCDEPRS